VILLFKDWRDGILKRIVIIIIVILSFSCSKEKGYLESFDKTADGWLNKPPLEEFDYSNYDMEPVEIPIVFIKDERLYEAADKLQEYFYIKLENKEYEYFTGLSKDNSSIAYLIRSVNYAFNESGYSIYKNDKNNLLITHSTLGSGKWKGCQKWPIIILYNGTINKIYTDYSVVS
jgi:hypothetical protein